MSHLWRSRRGRGGEQSRVICRGYPIGHRFPSDLPKPSSATSGLTRYVRRVPVHALKYWRRIHTNFTCSVYTRWFTIIQQIDYRSRSSAICWSSVRRVFILGLQGRFVLVRSHHGVKWWTYTSSSLASRACFSSCKAKRFSASNLVLCFLSAGYCRLI